MFTQHIINPSSNVSYSRVMSSNVRYPNSTSFNVRYYKVMSSNVRYLQGSVLDTLLFSRNYYPDVKSNRFRCYLTN